MQLVRPTLSNCARNVTQSANPSLWSGLVGAWVPALGVQSRMLIDVSGNNNNGVMTGLGVDAWVGGHHGLALDIGPNTNDGKYVTLPSSIKAPLNNGFTISIWALAKATTTYNRFFGNQGVTTTGLNFQLWLVGSKWAMWFGDFGGNTSYGNTPVTLNRWTHLALVWNGVDTASLYVDGRLDVEHAKAGPETSSTAPIRYGGAAGTGTDWAGQLGDAVLYSRALSLSEITQLYTDPLAPWRRIERRLFAVSSGSTPPASGYKPFYSLRKYRWGLQ